MRINGFNAYLIVCMGYDLAKSTPGFRSLAVMNLVCRDIEGSIVQCNIQEYIGFATGYFIPHDIELLDLCTLEGLGTQLADFLTQHHFLKVNAYLKGRSDDRYIIPDMELFDNSSTIFEWECRYIAIPCHSINLLVISECICSNAGYAVTDGDGGKASTISVFIKR